MGNEASSQNLAYGERLQNDVSVEWKPSGQPSPFPAREGHCACGVGGKLVVFGGVLEGVQESNGVISYDVEKGTWSSVQVKGQLPCPRSAATMSAVGTKLYLFGGLSHDVGWLDDLFVLDTETWSWNEVTDTQGPAPSPRDKVASATVGNKVYFFGGFGPKDGWDTEESTMSEDEEEEEDVGQGAKFTWYDDLYIFDTDTNTWENPEPLKLGAPTPRAAHALCAMGKKLVVFGGRDREARKNDLYILDTETMKWQQCKVSGQQPEPRSFHTATAVGHRVVITGGRGLQDQHFADFNIFDTKTKEWLQPALHGTKPAPRGMHTATVVADQFVLFGGSSDVDPETMQCQKRYADLFCVPTEEVLSGKSIQVTVEENKENAPATTAPPQDNPSQPPKAPTCPDQPRKPRSSSWEEGEVPGMV
ncbi:kelch domain-containing protein 1-like [Branchiostoma floridae x Branchiostoma japonicum]